MDDSKAVCIQKFNRSRSERFWSSLQSRPRLQKQLSWPPHLASIHKSPHKGKAKAGKGYRGVDVGDVWRPRQAFWSPGHLCRELQKRVLGRLWNFWLQTALESANSGSHEIFSGRTPQQKNVQPQKKKCPPKCTFWLQRG